MANMNQEKKKILAPAIKAVLKKYNVKATLAVQDNSTLVVNIKSGPIDFDLGPRNYCREVEDWIVLTYKGVARDFLLELQAAMNVGNHNNSDVMTDYFDVGWYIEINVGKKCHRYLKTSPATSSAE